MTPPTVNVAAVTQNALALANAAILVHGVIVEMGATHFAKAIDGESVTRDRLEQIVAQRIASSIQKTA